MKIGVISDIHSNVIALKVCIEFLENEGCKEYLLLGDYISDTPYTRETLDFIYNFISSHTCFLLRGNREDYMINQRKTRENGVKDDTWIYNSASGNLLYTYELLTDEDFLFFENLPISFIYEKEGYPPIMCCHGSPDNNRELLFFGSDRTRYWLEHIDTEYMLCAHTHLPGEMTYKGKYYFNTGSVGIAIKDAGYAQCIMLESVNSNGKVFWKPKFLKIPYDNKKVVEDIITGGLLYSAPWFINSNIQTLLTGTDNSPRLCELALKLAIEADKSSKWPLIDEKYFEAAAQKLQIPDYRKINIDEIINR